MSKCFAQAWIKAVSCLIFFFRFFSSLFKITLLWIYVHYEHCCVHGKHIHVYAYTHGWTLSYSAFLCLSLSHSISLCLFVDLLSPSLTECNSSPLFQYHLLYFVRALCHLEINLHRRQTFCDLSVHFTQTFHDLSVHFRQAHCDLSALILMYMMQTHTPLHSDFDVYLVQSSSSSSSIP